MFETIQRSCLLGIFKHKKRQAPFNNIAKSLCKCWIMKFLMILQKFLRLMIQVFLCKLYSIFSLLLGKVLGILQNILGLSKYVSLVIICLLRAWCKEHLLEWRIGRRRVYVASTYFLEMLGTKVCKQNRLLYRHKTSPQRHCQKDS